MKNKSTLIIITIMALLLCVSAASAAVTVTSTYSSSSPTFGGPSQPASHPDSDDRDERNIYVNSLISVANSDTVNAVTINSITVTSANSRYSTSSMNITLSSPVTVPANGSSTISLNARIPEDLDAVEIDEDSDNYLEPIAYKVALIQLKDVSGTVLASFDAYMQRENNFEVKDGKVYIQINDDSDFTVKDGEKTDEEILPGDTITVWANLKNKFASNDDLTLDGDIRFVLDSDTDSDWDWDNIEEEESFSIESGDTLDMEDDNPLVFEIDDSVDEYEDYDAELQFIATDDYDAMHGAKLKIRMDVNRQSYDFRISSATLNPSVIQCGVSRSATADIRLESFGKKGDSEITVLVKSLSLGLDYKQTNLKMDEYGETKDTLSVSVPLTISSTAAAGTYPVRVTLYYSGTDKDGVQADLRDIDLVIDSCKTQTIPLPADNEDDDVVINSGSSAGSTVNLPPQVAEEFGITETTETSFFDTRAFDIILVAAVLVAFGSLIFLVVKFFVL